MTNIIPASQRIAAFGVTKTVSEWVQDQLCLVGESELRLRLHRGWTSERAITTRSSSDGGKLSRFRGVTWHRKSKSWMAQIKHEGRVICLGYFADDEVAAAKAYDAAARKYRGSDAECNFGD
jgi:hypothetical protein